MCTQTKAGAHLQPIGKKRTSAHTKANDNLLLSSFFFSFYIVSKKAKLRHNCYMIHQAYQAGAWRRRICALVFACSRRGALRPSWEAPNCPGSSDRLPERPCPSLTTSGPMCTASQSDRRFPGRTRCTGARCLKCQNAKVILIRYRAQRIRLMYSQFILMFCQRNHNFLKVGQCRETPTVICRI